MALSMAVELMAHTQSSGRLATPPLVHARDGPSLLPLRVTTVKHQDEHKEEIKEEHRDEHQDVGSAGAKDEEIRCLSEEER